MIGKSECAKHGMDMMAKLDDLRKQKVLCDVTLLAAGAMFSAHRNVLAVSCPYFYKLFTSHMKEKTAESVALDALDVTSQVFDNLLTYLYTGEIDVTEFNAEELVICADYFLMTELKTMASEVLKSKLRFSNCLFLLNFARRFNCDSLAKVSRVFVDKHFEPVTQSDDFLELSVDQIMDLISNDNVFVKQEETIFEALVTWIEHDLPVREIHFQDLFSSIRLHSMSHEYIQTRVINYFLVEVNSSCLDQTTQALKMTKLANPSLYQRPRNCLQPPIDVIVSLSGTQKSTSNNPSEVRCYVPDEDKWYEMQQFPVQINWHGFVECEGALYTVGGERNGDVSCAFEKFDFHSNSWVKTSPMMKEVLFPAAASLGSDLYVIGSSRLNRGTLQVYTPSLNMWTLGRPLRVAREITCAVGDGQFLYAIGGMRAGDGEYLKSVERYDPENDVWTDISPMLKPRGGSCAVFKSNCIYVIGGECSVRLALSSCEVYSIASDQWHSIAAMHVPRYFAGAAVIGETIYVFGGVGGSNVPIHQRRIVERYDLKNNAWSADLVMPWEAKYFRCCLVHLRKDFLLGLSQVLSSNAL